MKYVLKNLFIALLFLIIISEAITMPEGLYSKILAFVSICLVSYLAGKLSLLEIKSDTE